MRRRTQQSGSFFLALFLLVSSAWAEESTETTFQQAVCQGYGAAVDQLNQRRTALIGVTANVRIEIVVLVLQEVDNIVFGQMDGSAVPTSKGPINCNAHP